jgi:transposase InsO family protein
VLDALRMALGTRVSRSQLELALVEYVGWFNHDRLHQSLGDIPPAEF